MPVSALRIGKTGVFATRGTQLRKPGACFGHRLNILKASNYLVIGIRNENDQTILTFLREEFRLPRRPEPRQMLIRML